MTTPPDPNPSTWSKLVGIWVAVNFGIPLFQTLCLGYGFAHHTGKGSFSQIAFFAGFFVLPIANLVLAWRLSQRRLGLSILIFLGSLCLDFALFFVGCLMVIKAPN
jgi:hypothetical protein